ncbi:zinc transporter ZupT [Pseudobythopirellula maris]|uniref:Zinc transporter ZupT n=1 Tax=Pseudobythopirellula maris TaxID=2527991 RepID=A0A5C5ZK10_9BACT|nr:ZIP family metal transporter [Pseudobythopirellula maris]TWT87729.1 zinc transporter ZupT [Pseudobythopirellula maris]
MPSVILAYYCLLIVAASVVGGLLPQWLRMTHRGTELAVSFVAGTMLGVAMLHLMPHAIRAAGPGASLLPTFRWVIVGFLAMFFIERFFCFHHHDLPSDTGEGPASDAGDAPDPVPGGCTHDHPHTDHAHNLTWGGAALGLTLHSLLAGVALGASVGHGAQGGASLPGLGTFFAIVLHKPFDAMTIAMLMGKGGWSPAARSLVNALFALVIPIGVAIYYLTVSPRGEPSVDGFGNAGYALAFSAGVFLCIAMSDLLPELQFHHHDRFKLSLALLLGLGAAEVASRFETHEHGPAPPVPVMSEPAQEGSAQEEPASGPSGE